MSTQLRNEHVLSSLRTQTVEELSALLTRVLSKADDWLFDLAQSEGESIDPFQHSPHLEAMKRLRGARAEVERNFRHYFTGLFEGLSARAQRDMAGVSQRLEGELSLIEEGELEQQLASDLVVDALTRGFGRTFDQLSAQLAILLAVPTLDPKLSPLSAHSIGHGLHRSLRKSELPTQLLVVLFKYYERELLQGLGMVLQLAVQRLASAGIIAPDPAQRRSNPTATGNAPSSSRTAAPQNDNFSTNTADRELFDSIKQLLHTLRPQQRQAAGDGSYAQAGFDPNRRALQPDEILSVLSLMQSDPVSPAAHTFEHGNIPLAEQIKRDLIERSARIGLAPERVRISADEEDAMDLVGMLFDVLLDERDFEERARSLISRLIVPFVKVALLDRRMFLHKTHPARRLLNSVAEACEGNRGEGPHERELLGKAEQVVDRLTTEFNEDIAIFDIAEQELRTFLEQHHRRIELAERRAAEAQRGQERLEQARSLAAHTLAMRIEGKKLPASLLEFLTRQWTHHLAVVALREGENSPAWKASLHLADQLLAHLPGGVSEGADLDSAIAQMHDEAIAVLASSGVTGDSAENALRALISVLIAFSRGNLRDLAQLGITSIDSKQLSTSTASHQPQLRVVGGKDTYDFDAGDLPRLTGMAVGTWVNIMGEDERLHPAKLAWISPISQRLMFVNRRGVRILVASAEELAAMKKQGKLTLREQDNAFDDAMQRMLGRLRSDVA